MIINLIEAKCRQTKSLKNILITKTLMAPFLSSFSNRILANDAIQMKNYSNISNSRNTNINMLMIAMLFILWGE